jgi:hypothetical protein
MALDQAERDRLHKELVKLADMLETCESGDANHKYYNNEYRKVAKLLYPEMYPHKRRKPDQKFIRSLHVCDCGEKLFTYRSSSDGVQILCVKCTRKSEIKETNAEARDSWNATFENKS